MGEWKKLKYGSTKKNRAKNQRNNHKGILLHTEEDLIFRGDYNKLVFPSMPNGDIVDLCVVIDVKGQNIEPLCCLWWIILSLIDQQG